MTYFYNSHDGAFANESPPAPQYFVYEAKLHLGIGWHAYGSLAEMNAAVKANGWPAPNAAAAGSFSANAGIAGASAAQAPGKAAADVLGGLNLNNWLLRIGEILAGLILLGIGVNAMFKGRPMQLVTGAAGAAARVVP